MYPSTRLTSFVPAPVSGTENKRGFLKSTKIIGRARSCTVPSSPRDVPSSNHNGDYLNTPTAICLRQRKNRNCLRLLPPPLLLPPFLNRNLLKSAAWTPHQPPNRVAVTTEIRTHSSTNDPRGTYDRANTSTHTLVPNPNETKNKLSCQPSNFFRQSSCFVVPAAYCRRGRHY